MKDSTANIVGAIVQIVMAGALIVVVTIVMAFLVIFCGALFHTGWDMVH